MDGSGSRKTAEQALVPYLPGSRKTGHFLDVISNMIVRFHDSALIVADKPSGLLSVPGRGPEKQDCLVARLRALYPDMIAQPAVHRLDMATSGLMIVARTRQAHRELSRQFQQGTVQKEYIALVAGAVRGRGGRICLRFRLDPDDRPRQIYDPFHGKTGITLWRRLAVEGSHTRILFIPLTGRTHQLRLHAAHMLGLGAPIVGDPLYGNGKEGERLLLHASALRFRHPLSGEHLHFRSAAPF